MTKNNENSFTHVAGAKPFTTLKYDGVLAKVYLSNDKEIQGIQVDLCRTLNTDLVHIEFPEDILSNSILKDVKAKVDKIDKKNLDQTKDTVYTCNTFTYLFSYKHNTCLVKKHWGAYDLTKANPVYCPAQSPAREKEIQLCQYIYEGREKQCAENIQKINSALTESRNRKDLSNQICSDPVNRNKKVADVSIGRIERKI